MSAKKSKTRSKTKAKSKPKKVMRTYEAETSIFDPLRLIAAPDPKDDLDPDEILAYAKANSHSPELIQQLIDYIQQL